MSIAVCDNREFYYTDIIKETEKAWLLHIDYCGGIEVWLPKSECKLAKVVQVPEWLGRKIRNLEHLKITPDSKKPSQVEHANYEESQVPEDLAQLEQEWASGLEKDLQKFYTEQNCWKCECGKIQPGDSEFCLACGVIPEKRNFIKDQKKV